MQYVPMRANLFEEVASLVRDMILDGRLPAGRRINELKLSSEIGVSRTPLREALQRLASEGALRDEPRRGFFVRPLTAEEVRSIYPIRAILDPAALRLAGVPSTDAIAQLRNITRELAACTDPAEVVRLDDVFHLELIAGCPNPVLIDLIRQFMWRTRRYELGLQQHRVGIFGGSKERILAALERGDLARACRELEGSMMRGQEPVLKWLAERDQSKAGGTNEAHGDRAGGV
jgi:DNA-binding GntR family transcriptional regulator